MKTVRIVAALFVALVMLGAVALTAQAAPSTAAFASVAAPQGRVAEMSPPAADLPDCKVITEYEYECVYKGVIKVNIKVDPDKKQVTIKIYIGHKTVGWKKVEERTFTKDGVQDRICGKAFGHEACVETEINWTKKFVKISVYYDGELKFDKKFEW